MRDEAFHHRCGAILAIEGAFTPLSLALWDILLAHQETQRIVGPLMEIGVLHGRSAAMLASHLWHENDRLILVDPFFGDRPIADRLDRLKPGAAARTDFIEDYSWYIRDHEAVRVARNRTRWLHIDGEHTGDAVLADLHLADELLSYNGIVTLDDFFTPYYPQITKAVFQYLDRYPGKFDLFMMGDCKAYLARPRYAHVYRTWIEAQMQTQLRRRNMAATIAKTTYNSDMNCFSIVPDEIGHGPFYGPDFNRGKFFLETVREPAGTEQD